MNLYEEHIKRQMEWQEKMADFKALKREQAEHQRLVHEAARLNDRTIPSATEEWHDLQQRRHIAPWTDHPEERKHEIHSLNCWCNPILYKDIVFHWDK